MVDATPFALPFAGSTNRSRRTEATRDGGFAGGLNALDPPAVEMPMALLGFNIGLEVGQLAFIAAILLAWGCWRRGHPFDHGAQSGAATGRNECPNY